MPLAEVQRMSDDDWMRHAVIAREIDEQQQRIIAQAILDAASCFLKNVKFK